MPDFQYGVILALHVNRPKGDFTVLRRVIPEWPFIPVETTIKEALALPAFTHAWFQPITLPEGVL